MNHEKAIEEAAHSAASEIIIHPGLKMSPIIARHMRALVSTIQRAESQRGDTSPQEEIERLTTLQQNTLANVRFWEESAEKYRIQLKKLTKGGDAPCSLAMKPQREESALAEIPDASRVISNAAPDVPSEGVPPNPDAPETPAWFAHLSVEGARAAATKAASRWTNPQPVEPAASETPIVDAAEYLASANPPFRGERGILNGQHLVVTTAIARDLERRLRSSEAECRALRKPSKHCAP